MRYCGVLWSTERYSGVLLGTVGYFRVLQGTVGYCRYYWVLGGLGCTCSPLAGGGYCGILGSNRGYWVVQWSTVGYCWILLGYCRVLWGTLGYCGGYCSTSCALYPAVCKPFSSLQLQYTIRNYSALFPQVHPVSPIVF